MAAPMMSPADARQHAAFTALMWALSYPGRPARLPAAGPDALGLIGETLVDLETGFFTPDAALAARLARTGGRGLPAAAAPYQFYPRLGPAELELLAAAPVGSHAAPDLGATVVVGCAIGQGARLRLSGPGIAGSCEVLVGGLPDELWELRAATVRAPLGWDLFLVAGELVLGVPRTTAVEVLPWPM
ncbi:phosphonate C-P lyase system protein PhnH [Oscillochloris sp. ZM17-4]|uniref:phosphonate C-P lyase system protein PhnH n=1 Tax=Oscillochloris sp. ZM17-4 TaxID=2866714 RepID=UPI001C739E04|nr:phosphonate C-P lyase system protein PhnH [Oscillochloris sp. ZM17-4]MBX0329387.1 phosphonate C-P lyase system protein PhnH [Oscillochloris sp. ZM17-4]